MRSNLTFLLLFCACSTFAQLTLTVTDVPSNTPMDADIFVAGSFNGWDPGDDTHKLANLGNGTYEITISPAPGTLKFKFTRGSWATVEGNANGGFLPDRVLNYNGSATTVEFEILSWEDTGGTGNSTAADNVFILDDDFYIPQLDRNRRIWIYLPPDYETSNKYYPVLYMHDGQNLFDVQTSFSGEWEIDESLNALFLDGDHGAIVVGIDNGQALRIDELSPWYNDSYNAGGEGGEYIDFIVETLKPHIDANYRTLMGRDFTCLFGSSLGGLISQYGIIEHQDVFGKAGVFSPAFWFNPEIFDHSANTPKTGFMKIFMLAGAQEGNGSVVNDVNQMEGILFNNGFTEDELEKAIHADGQHSEWYWAREFPAAYEWLFDGLDLTDASELEAANIRIYPNPADTMLYFENVPSLKKPVVRLFSIDGKMQKKECLINGRLDVSALQPGVYVVQIDAKRQFRFTEKIIVY